MEASEFTGEVSAEDWRRARRALQRWHTAVIWSGPVFLVLFGIFYMARRGEVRAWDLLGTIFGAVWLAYEPLIDTWRFHGWLRPRVGESNFRFAPFEFEMKTPQLRGPIRWSQLERVTETKEYFILGSAPHCWCVIPRRLMDAATEARWRELAEGELAVLGKRIELWP